MYPTFMKDRDLPVIVGHCPRCRNEGDRVLVMMEFHNNKKVPEKSLLKIKCMACTSEFEATLRQLTKTVDK